MPSDGFPFTGITDDNSDLLAFFKRSLGRTREDEFDGLLSSHPDNGLDGLGRY